MSPFRHSLNGKPGSRAATPLCLLTINAHKGFSFLNRAFVLHELRDAVRSTGADLVFLQEVHGEHRGHARRQHRWPPLPHYEFLADSIWPDYAYGRNAVYPEGDHGNALLSRFPISEHSNIDVSVGRQEPRGILHCRIRIPPAGREVHAFCVHLGLRESHRRAQLLQLVEHIRTRLDENAAVIVAGDFNDWRQRAGPLLARAGLRETFVECGQQPARTFPGWFPRLRLDRIYVRGLRIVDASALTTAPWPHLTDHVPLLSKVQL
jgi:endonuclease/exonuclease/phosphatase family metal-dependent hydrolase